MVWFYHPEYKFDLRARNTMRPTVGDYTIPIPLGKFNDVIFPQIANGDIMRIARMHKDQTPMIFDLTAEDNAGEIELTTITMKIGLAFIEEEANSGTGDFPTSNNSWDNYFCAINMDGTNATSRVNIAGHTMDKVNLIRTNNARSVLSIADVWKRTISISEDPIPEFFDITVLFNTIVTNPPSAGVRLVFTAHMPQDSIGKENIEID